MSGGFTGAPLQQIDPHVNERAFGEWENEVDACSELDRRLEACGLFEKIFKEVRGYYLAQRPNREDKNARIDRILIPNQRLRDAGWGRAIGIEIKRSGESIGPAIAQAIDYTYCSFNVGNYWMMCERIFLWPFKPQTHAIKSVMVQNGIGVLYENLYSSPEWDRPLVFEIERQVISVTNDWRIDKCVDTVSSRKKGSR